MPNRLLEALCNWPLSRASLRLFLYVARQTLGWKGKAAARRVTMRSPFCNRCAAAATGLHARTVSVEMNKLEDAGFIEWLESGRVRICPGVVEALRPQMARCQRHLPEGSSNDHPRLIKRSFPDDQTVMSDRPNDQFDSPQSYYTQQPVAPERKKERKIKKKKKEIPTSSAPASPGTFQITSDKEKTTHQKQIAYVVGFLPKRLGKLSNSELDAHAEAVIKEAERRGIHPILIVESVPHGCADGRERLAAVLAGDIPVREITSREESFYSREGWEKIWKGTQP